MKKSIIIIISIITLIITAGCMDGGGSDTDVYLLKDGSNVSWTVQQVN